ncbi:fumarate/nitrate reduction transcriptional regulator Fnr [Ramlibacter sp.]|uniref:fumarate/nitrate reduction transcriptional regulator Fnr n=1 Tax=Ramlibacter sp. TaxID=1917967 RepID=UPI002B72C9DA|nr:fumarate/nitrate reduction transcriptional regulator Fnr [Ramlibacter sp.]HWI83313.1 fumarate/nitrate reduction transcriptional regulator Fnr [Ramlibacter sp.]
MTAATETTVKTVRFLPPGAVALRAPAAPVKTQCSTCHLRELCLPAGMSEVDLTRLDQLSFTRRKIKAGETLYREGDKFTYIYAVRSGTLKSSLMLSDGREQVSGFHIAGELVGLDGVAQGRHASAAMALEDSEVCAISYAALTELAVSTSGMQHIVSRMMSREILREHSLMMLLGSMHAEERLAAFLLNLSQRYAARGYSDREFHLRMSRAEIGSYLGMKLETVSRAFSAFQQQGMLEVDKRHIRITDLEELKRRFDVRVH